MTETDIPMQSVKSLGPSEKTGSKEKDFITEEEKKIFAEHLEKFIVALEPDDEEKQQKLLDIAVKQFEGIPIQKAKSGCNKCYGVGFTAYNRTYKYFDICKCILNQMK